MTKQIYLDEKTVASLCNVTFQTLNNWRHQKAGPVRDEKTKLYEAGALGQWMVKELTLRSGRGGGYPWMPDLSRLPAVTVDNPPALPGLDGTSGTVPAILTKEQEETRLKKAQADKAELDLIERAGQLVKVDDVNAAWIDITARVKAKLTRIPSALAQLAHGKTTVFEVQSVLDDGVREALDELSEDWREAAEIEQDG